MPGIVESPTFIRLRDVGRSGAEAADVENILTEESFATGQNFDIVLAIAASIGAEASSSALALSLRRFFSSVEGDHLDALASDIWDLDRKRNILSIGEVTFTRSAPAVAGEAVAAGVIVSTADGVRFRTTDATYFNPADLAKTVPVEAEIPGVGGNVNASEIVNIDEPNGALTSGTWVVENTEATAGGAPDEEDDAFKLRIERYPLILRRGTIDALKYGAGQVAQVAQVGVDEVPDPIIVYVADANDQFNAAMITAVEDELESWRAAGVPINVDGAVVVVQAVTMTLTFRAGFDTQTQAQLAREAVIAYSRRLDVGETFKVSAAQAAAIAVEGVIGCDISVPAGDVVPLASERVSVDQVTVS